MKLNIIFKIISLFSIFGSLRGLWKPIWIVLLLLIPQILFAAFFSEENQVRTYCVSPANSTYSVPSEEQLVKNITGQNKPPSNQEENALGNLELAVKLWSQEAFPMTDFKVGIFLNFCGPRAVTISMTSAQSISAQQMFEDTGVNFSMLDTKGTEDLMLLKESLLAEATLKSGNEILDAIAKKVLEALVLEDASLLTRTEFLSLIKGFDSWWEEKVEINAGLILSPSHFALRFDTVFGGSILEEFRFLSKSAGNTFEEIINYNFEKEVNWAKIQMRGVVPVEALMLLKGGQRPWII